MINKNPLGKKYIFVTKPLHYISYYIIGLCILGIIASLISNLNKNNGSIQEMIIYPTLFIFFGITTHYYTDYVMRYYLYEDSLYVPRQWIKPRGKNQIILFNNIKRITFKKDTYALVDVNDISYKINPTFNKELIPQIQSVLGNRWHQLYHDGKQLINNQH